MVDVTDSGFADEVLAAGRPVVVDFWAPWCGPCKAVEGALGELEAEYGDRVAFVKMNVDEEPERAAEHGVLSLPTVILFADGAAQVTVVGPRPRKHFEKTFAAWLA